MGLKFPDMSRPETLQKKYVGKVTKRALHFMKSVLQMDPGDRQTGGQCIHNPYFEDLRVEYQARTQQHARVPGLR